MEEIAKAAGKTAEEIVNNKDRGAVMELMSNGAAILAERLYKEGKFHGIIGMGGGINIPRFPISLVGINGILKFKVVVHQLSAGSLEIRTIETRFPAEMAILGQPRNRSEESQRSSMTILC